MSNQTGEVWITSDDNSDMLVKKALPPISNTPLHVPSFYKVLFQIVSSGGDVNYDLGYCEAEGNVCKYDMKVIYEGIGAGAACLIILVVSGPLIYFFCYRKQNQVANEQSAEAPGNVQIEEFEPYDELELDKPNDNEQRPTGWLFLVNYMHLAGSK